MKTKKSRLRMEIKEITADGSFEGLLSPYGNVDGGMDVILPGAYTKTIKDNGPKVPMLWQHKSDVPIGELTLDDRKDGLWCSGQLLMELPKAQEAYLLIKNRIVKGLSIGFESVKDSIQNGVRSLKEIRLYEGSIVTFPMNEAAQITSVKSKESKGDFLEELATNQTLSGYYQMFSALEGAMADCVWSDVAGPDKLAMAKTVLQQFTDTFTDFFPDYLNAIANVYGIGVAEEWSSKRDLEIKAVKSGARHSAATKSTLMSGLEQIKSGHDAITALLTDEADATDDNADDDDSDTSGGKAATHDTKTEPDSDHSAALEEIRALIPA